MAGGGVDDSDLTLEVVFTLMRPTFAKGYGGQVGRR